MRSTELILYLNNIFIQLLKKYPTRASVVCSVIWTFFPYIIIPFNLMREENIILMDIYS